MLILSRKSYFKKFFLQNNLDRKVIIAVSDIEYNNDELSLHWFKYFYKHICKKR